MKQLNDPRLRKSLYVILSAVGVVLVTYGVIEQAALDAVLTSIPGVLMAIGGGVAVANTPTSKHDSTNASGELAVYNGLTSVPAEDGGYIGRHRLGG